jgi:putative hydrolase of the HAD superfamily
MTSTSAPGSSRDRAGDPAPLRDAEAWVFDLDNTLYSAAYDLFQQIDTRMRAYIADFLGLALDEAYRLQKRYFAEYGTSLRGLMHRHGMDPVPFLEHVHEIDVSVLPPSPDLDAALAGLPGRKIIFTNASQRHAERVTDRLGIAHHFDAVFDIVDANFAPKPDPEAYAGLVRRFELNPRATVMVEDIARNLAPAAALGMTTVWIRNDTEHGRHGLDSVPIDHMVDDLTVWLAAMVAR